jgi:hypothetical protein
VLTNIQRLDCTDKENKIDSSFRASFLSRRLRREAVLLGSFKRGQWALQGASKSYFAEYTKDISDAIEAKRWAYELNCSGNGIRLESWLLLLRSLALAIPSLLIVLEQHANYSATASTTSFTTLPVLPDVSAAF